MSAGQGIGRDKALTVLYRSPLPIGFQPLPCGWLLRPSISSAGGTGLPFWVLSRGVVDWSV